MPEPGIGTTELFTPADSSELMRRQTRLQNTKCRPGEVQRLARRAAVQRKAEPGKPPDVAPVYSTFSPRALEGHLTKKSAEKYKLLSHIHKDGSNVLFLFNPGDSELEKHGNYI